MACDSLRAVCRRAVLHQSTQPRPRALVLWNSRVTLSKTARIFRVSTPATPKTFPLCSVGTKSRLELEPLPSTVDDPDALVGTGPFGDLLPTGRNKRAGRRDRKNRNAGERFEAGSQRFSQGRIRGACPPPGLPHRYFFKLYALDAPTNLKPRATKQQVLEAIKGHVMGEAELRGGYKR